MNIPEDIVEKAAEAIRETGKTHPRTRSMDGPAQLARAQARAALSAVAPHLMAMALRDAARDLSWFGAQGNTVEPNTAWAGVTACMNALNNIADELEAL